VENEMQNGLSFSEAYHMVRQKMGHRRLKEIQEETLYAVDTKYRHMKNTMRISGIAGTVLLGFGALFKIQHWPLAGSMTTLGGIVLALIFLPSALGVLWKETHNRKRLLLFISAFFAGGFFILGTIFKIQHWPGAGIILTLAAVSGIILYPRIAYQQGPGSGKQSQEANLYSWRSRSNLLCGGIVFQNSALAAGRYFYGSRCNPFMFCCFSLVYLVYLERRKPYKCQIPFYNNRYVINYGARSPGHS
jgi:hypothetical protein